MNWQKITEMPCVIKVIRTAETEIKEMIGKEVILIVAEVNMTKEDRKAVLQDTVCSYFKVSWKDVVSKKRDRDIINARHSYMYFASKYCTCKEVGEDCGGRDHSSVVSAVQKMDGFYRVKDDFITHLENIKNLLPKQILQ